MAKPFSRSDGKEECGTPGKGVPHLGNQKFLERKSSENLLGVSKNFLTRCLLALEALAIHALLLGGIALVGADLHGGQSAVLLVAAMMSALFNGAVDSGIGIVVHRRRSPLKKIWLMPRIVCAFGSRIYVCM